MPLSVAILGRPNVGKSTLFNRLVGRRQALVADVPGVTRDRREGEARLGDLRFTAIDTAGLAEARGDTLAARVQAQTDRALADCDVALFLIDARAGLTPLDRHVGRRLRQAERPVILVANKCEGRGGEAGLLDAYALGLGEPVAVSAEHGEGMADLYDALRPFADRAAAPAAGAAEAAESETAPAPLRMAVVGRPNVGKSTLINRLIGEERLVTDREAGTTRDAIAVSWRFRGRPIRLVDTAGLRRRARVSETLEQLAAGDTLRAIRFAHVAVVVIDATRGVESQDLAIAALVADEGRAPVVAANKWDRVDDRAGALGEIRARLSTSLAQVAGVRLVTLSALTGERVERLMPAVLAAHDAWCRRVATAPLNRWLEEMTLHHPPPAVAGRRIRLRYATQAKARPPTFVVFASRPEALPESYLRYLAGGLRDRFGLDGVPVRILVRKGRNPFAPRA